MHPRVSAIIAIPDSADPGPLALAAAATLRAQSLPDFEALFAPSAPALAGGAAARHTARLDSRFRPPLGRPLTDADALTVALRGCRAPLVTLLDARDTLEPDAFARLVAAAEADPHPAASAGVVGTTRVLAPIGPLPAPPPITAPVTPFPPPHAALLRREHLDYRAFAAGLDTGGDIALLRSLAAAGLHLFPLANAHPVANFHLRPLRSPADTLANIAARLHTLSTAPTTDPDDHAHHLALAYTLLSGFHAALDRAGNEHLTTARAFPNLFAHWWARQGFYGPPPLHLLDPSPFSSGWVTPERVAAHIARSIPPHQPVLLLGLGNNAQHLARALATSPRTAPILGRDDALSTPSPRPPAWAAAAGLRVETLPLSTPPDPAWAIIATPTHDAAILANLPPAFAKTTIARWSHAARTLFNADAAAARATLSSGAAPWSPAPHTPTATPLHCPA